MRQIIVFYFIFLCFNISGAILSPDIQEILKTHHTELRNIYLGIREKTARWLPDNALVPGIRTAAVANWLPGYVFKITDFTRASNASKLKQIIAEYGLDLLDVPDKYIYKFTSTDNDPTKVVIAQKIEGTLGSQANLNVEQVKQLYKLARYANYYDMHPQNYIVSSVNKKIYIIDTDSRNAMPPFKETIKRKFLWLFSKGDDASHHPSLWFQRIVDDPLSFFPVKGPNEQAKSGYAVYNKESEEWLKNQFRQRDRRKLVFKTSIVLLTAYWLIPRIFNVTRILSRYNAE